MNVFIIPSWYPTENNPIAGIFFKEQASYISELYPNINIGISIWGQSDSGLLISAKNISRIKVNLEYYQKLKPSSNFIKENLQEIFTPVIRWSQKVYKGNISGILKANLSNLSKFEESFGKTDLIHAHVSFPAGYIAMEIAKKLDIPYVITEHMGPFPFKAFLSKEGKIHPILEKPIRNASKVIAVSPALSRDISAFGFKKPIFIPNVIDEDFFKPKRAVSTSTFHFFTLAILAPEKGIDDLLEAIKIVSKENTEVHFTIGGGGEMLTFYKEKAIALQIDKFVHWLGNIEREEARKQYQKCHAFVLPTHGETFGVVFAEAIACGKPVIATRSGGPECIVDEKNGIFANIQDPQDLAKKMLFVIKNYEKYNSTEIRENFEQRFSKKAVIPKIVDVYNSVL